MFADLRPAFPLIYEYHIGVGTDILFGVGGGVARTQDLCQSVLAYL